MKPLREVRKEAQADSTKKEFLLFLPRCNTCNATWIDPWLGVFTVKGFDYAFYAGDAEFNDATAITL